MEAQATQEKPVEKKPEEIVPVYDKTHAAIPSEFSFKSVPIIDPVTEQPEKDEKGEVKKKRRPTLKLVLRLITLEGVAKILTEGSEKEQELLLEAVRDVQMSQARDLISADEAISQETFPMDKLDWKFIANIPRAERRGGGISKDTWEAFVADYIAVMQPVTGKPLDTLKKHGAIYLSRFQLVRDRKDVLELLKGQLGLYMQNSQNAEQYTDVLEFLLNKAQQFLDFDPAKYLEAL